MPLSISYKSVEQISPPPSILLTRLLPALFFVPPAAHFVYP